MIYPDRPIGWGRYTNKRIVFSVFKKGPNVGGTS